MKYKLLVSGKSAMVTDFMKHAGKYFTMLSTTSYIMDVENHFKFFEPDAYITFADISLNESVTVIQKVKDYPSYNSAPIIIVGSEEICSEINSKFPHLVDLLIKRPISGDNLSLKIERFLDERKENIQNNANSNEENENSDVKKHILAVDDDRNVLKILKASLSEKYDVTTMANGVLVEKFLDMKDVNMIILDHEMPIETGADIFKKLKNHPKGKNIPVCFLTGVSDRAEIEKIMSLRPHGYLLKPINIEMLMATISNLIS